MAEDFPRTLAELEQRFSSEEACRQYLAALRWPEGVICPRCGGRTGWAMTRSLWLCARCRHQASVTAGTIFQDSRLPLTLWVRAMWHVVSQKNGVSALGLQRVLGLRSYKTAWLLVHKLRRAMVRPDRDRLHGTVEVDETYWGGEEKSVVGRLTHTKALILVAPEHDGRGIGRIRMRRLPDLTKASLHGFITRAVTPGSTVITDGLNAYRGLAGYAHAPTVQRRQAPGAYLLPRVHRVVSLLKRWLTGTHQGAVAPAHLDDYLDEFTFRFNRRKSASRGTLFYRLAEYAVQVPPATYAAVVQPRELGPG